MQRSQPHTSVVSNVSSCNNDFNLGFGSQKTDTCFRCDTSDDQVQHKQMHKDMTKRQIALEKWYF